MTVLEVFRNAMGRPLASRQPRVEEEDSADFASLPAGPVLQSDSVSEEELPVLQALAATGDAAAQRRLGMACYRGVGVPRDHAEAFKWLTLAAENGDPVAVQDHLLILQGMTLDAVREGRKRVASFKGLPEPPPMGLRADGERGPEAGAPSADGWVAPESPVVFLEPDAMEDAPLPGEVKRAWAVALVAVLVVLAGGVVWLSTHEMLRTRTASFITSDGQTGGPQMSAAFSGGKSGTATEPAKPEYASVEEMKTAAERGEVRAQFLLGLAYAKGDGADKDFVQAAAWYQKAAEQGDANAQNNLGVLHVQGTGVALNAVTAYKWFSLAAKSGLHGAGVNRDQLALMLTGAQLADAVRQVQAFASAHALPTGSATP